MTTEQSVSPSVSTAEAWTSLIVLTAVYGVLAVVEVRLLLTYIRKGAEPLPDPTDSSEGRGDDRPLAFAY